MSGAATHQPGRMPPRLLLPPTLLLFALLCVRVAPSGPPDAACVPPRGLAADDAQAAAFALASRGELRRAVPCFAAALLQGGGAHHSWLWTDYARALQGAAGVEDVSGLSRKVFREVLRVPPWKYLLALQCPSTQHALRSTSNARTRVLGRSWGSSSRASSRWRARPRTSC